MTARRAVQPPHDFEAEQAVLGAMMVEREAALTAAALLEPEDFHQEPHQCLFRIMARLADRGPFDLVNVRSALHEEGRLDAIGGGRYLVELLEAAPSAVMAKSYAETVRRVATRRRRWLAALAFAGKPTDIDAETALIGACADAAGPGLSVTVYDIDALLEDPPPRPDSIVESMWLAQTVNIVAGPPASAKSWVGLAACLDVTAGRSFLGRFPCVKGPAVLVDEESALPMLAERIALLNASDPRPADAERFAILPSQGLHFDDPACQDALRSQIKHLRPRLLVVDTIAATAGAIDLVGNVTQVRAWSSFFRRLAQQYDLAAVLLAHGPKWQAKKPTLQNVFGSVDWGANADAVHALCDVGKGIFRLATVKDRWAPASHALDLTFSLVPTPSGGLALSSEPATQGVIRLILSQIDTDWTKGREVTEYIVEQGFTDRAVRAGFKKLVEVDHRLEQRPDPDDHKWREFRLREEDR
jgi:hypothetical protein